MKKKTSLSCPSLELGIRAQVIAEKFSNHFPRKKVGFLFAGLKTLPIFAESKHYGVSVSQSAVNAHNLLRAFFMPKCNLIDGCLSHIFSSSSGICNVLTNGKWQPFFFLPKKRQNITV